MANPCSWLFLLGPAPFAVCFASLLDGETHIWLGDLRFAFCVVVFVFCSVFDLPCYMTTGVNVDFISNCFFTCKDRALERDRPYQRKKKLSHAVPVDRVSWRPPSKSASALRRAPRQRVSFGACCSWALLRSATGFGVCCLWRCLFLCLFLFCLLAVLSPLRLIQ